MTTQGLVLCTFTPLEGMSEVVLHFLPGGKLYDAEKSNRKVVMATVDDVPHLSERDKTMLWGNESLHISVTHDLRVSPNLVQAQSIRLQSPI